MVEINPINGLLKSDKTRKLTFPNLCKFIFCSPKINEYRVVSGVAVDAKDSDLIPRFFVYHSVVFEIEFTVRTRWSRDLIVAAGDDDVILLTWREYWQTLRI
jgi:hypothetical protein